MTADNSFYGLAMRIRYDLTAAQAKLTDLIAAIDAGGLETLPRPPRAGSPRELHPDACPDCEIVAGHTADCPRVTG